MVPKMHIIYCDDNVYGLILLGDICCVSFTVSLSFCDLGVLKCPQSNNSKNAPNIVKTVLNSLTCLKSSLHVSLVRTVFQ